jgi:hypothetical protein
LNIFYLFINIILKILNNNFIGDKIRNNFKFPNNCFYNIELFNQNYNNKINNIEYNLNFFFFFEKYKIITNNNFNIILIIKNIILIKLIESIKLLII